MFTPPDFEMGFDLVASQRLAGASRSELRLKSPVSSESSTTAQFAELAEHQVEQGSDGIVVAGTTGEPSSLSVDERIELLKSRFSRSVAGFKWLPRPVPDEVTKVFKV